MEEHGSLPRPNFVVFVVDSMPASCLGANGNPHIHTPNLDALAADGINFQRAYCNTPVCMPSRASLMTGLNRRQHGVLTNGSMPHVPAPTMAGALVAAGYRTHVVGQIHAEPSGIAGAKANGQPISWESRAGWNDGSIAALPQPYYGFQSSDYIGGKGRNCYGDYARWLQQVAPGAHELYGQDEAYFVPDDSYGSWRMSLPRELHHTEWAANRCIDFLEANNTEQPFLLWCGFFDPHAPYAASRPYSDMYEPASLPLPPTWQDTGDGCEALRRYRDIAPYNTPLTAGGIREMAAQIYGMVTHIDECIGRVITHLKRSGAYDNTVIVFLSDHGDYMGAHHLLYKGPWPWEEVLRVPMIWKGLGGTRTDAVPTPVSLLDFVPTILDYANIDAQVLAPPRVGKSARPGLPGRSLHALLEHNEPLEPKPVLAELDEDFSPGAMLRMRVLITDKYKLGVFPPTGDGLLYDYERDPHECNNLWAAASHADVRANLTHQLLEELIWTDRLDSPRPCGS